MLITFFYHMLKSENHLHHKMKNFYITSGKQVKMVCINSEKLHNIFTRKHSIKQYKFVQL